MLVDTDDEADCQKQNQKSQSRNPLSIIKVEKRAEADSDEKMMPEDSAPSKVDYLDDTEFALWDALLSLAWF